MGIVKFCKTIEYGITDCIHTRENVLDHAAHCARVVADDCLFAKPIWIHSTQIKSVLMGKLTQCLAREQDGVLPKAVFLFFDDSQDKVWLGQHGIALSQDFPNSMTVDIQKQALSLTVGERNRRKFGICGGELLFYAVGITTAYNHNGANDATFEMQAFIAGLTMTDEQWDELAASGLLRPSLPALWEIQPQTQIQTAPQMHDRMRFPFLGIDRPAAPPVAVAIPFNAIQVSRKPCRWITFADYQAQKKHSKPLWREFQALCGIYEAFI